MLQNANELNCELNWIELEMENEKKALAEANERTCTDKVVNIITAVVGVKERTICDTQQQG